MAATQSHAIDGLAYRHVADIRSTSRRRRRTGRILAVILAIAIGCGCCGAWPCAKGCAECSWWLGACCIRIKDVLQCHKVTVVGGSAGSAAASGTAACCGGATASSSPAVAAAGAGGAAGGIIIDAWTTLRRWQHLILSSSCPAAAAATASCNGSLGSRAIAIRTGHIETMAGYGRIDGIALQIEGGRPSNGLGAIMSNDLQIVVNIVLSLSL